MIKISDCELLQNNSKSLLLNSCEINLPPQRNNGTRIHILKLLTQSNCKEKAALHQKPLPALPLPDFEKPLPPIPEIEEEFTFFFETMCRECGVMEGNTGEGWVQGFEMWVDTEDCGYCRDREDEVGAGGVDIREADMW